MTLPFEFQTSSLQKSSSILTPYITCITSNRPGQLETVRFIVIRIIVDIISTSDIINIIDGSTTIIAIVIIPYWKPYWRLSVRFDMNNCVGAQLGSFPSFEVLRCMLINYIYVLKA